MQSQRVLRFTEKLAVVAVGLLLLAALFALGQRQRYYKPVSKDRRVHIINPPSEIAPQ